MLWHTVNTSVHCNNFFHAAEWRSHEHSVAELLPKLKDAVYDADDLLDEFRWYEMKVELEGNASRSPFPDFFDNVIQGNFNKLKDVQARLDHPSSQLKRVGLREVKQRFDKLVRPETSSLPNEEAIFGRDKELKQVMGFLCVPSVSKRKRARSLLNTSISTSPSNQVSNESTVTNLPVLPIVGIGGVGKTTLAQHVCINEQVKAHFELVIWICVSDNFDVKRLTKEVIQSCLGKKTTTDNLDSLQRALSNHVKNKRFLIVLDDMWDDALKENGQCWKRFCAPLKSGQKGSMMLVTTRCPKVAQGVRTMEPIMLEGLKDDVFWNFFKLCAFGYEGSNNDPVLEHIGRRILPKLKGSPLASKTLGRMLRMDLKAPHWNSILESEIWELRQEATDIVPALRLSYMYLPFYLKQCFSFCAVYLKDYKFKKADLAEIWVAEGFVKPRGTDSLQDIGSQYFEDLLTRSFFQKVNDHYVIHDLLHDMAQKVSEHDCFILRNKNDYDKVPRNVRHVYILPNSGVVDSNLLSLCRHTKLRTLICTKQLRNKYSSVISSWCTKFLRIRLISCASTNELPNSFGNLKHLRYLKISEGCPLSIPSTVCRLYNLQILDVRKCKLESLPPNFSNLRNLQRFGSQGLSYPKCNIEAADNQVYGIKLMKNLNQLRGDLKIINVGMLSKGHAAEAELKNKKYLEKLTLKWLALHELAPKQPDPEKSQFMQENAIEVLQVLQPPISIRSLLLKQFPGISLPSWFQPQNNNVSIGVFLSLTDLAIHGCPNLLSLEHFLHPDYAPGIKKISVQSCESLVSVPTERFENFRYLEQLFVNACPSLNWQRGLVLPSSLQTLQLLRCGDFSVCFPRCLENIKSLLSLTVSGCQGVTSIPGSIWFSNLALLEELSLLQFPELVSIGGAEAVAKIKRVSIYECPKLKEAEEITRRGRRSSRRRKKQASWSL